MLGAIRKLARSSPLLEARPCSLAACQFQINELYSFSQRFSSTAEPPLPESSSEKAVSLDRPNDGQQAAGWRQGKNYRKEHQHNSVPARVARNPPTKYKDSEELIAVLNTGDLSVENLMMVMYASVQQWAALKSHKVSQEAVQTYYQLLANHQEGPAALPKDMLWDVMTKQLEFEPDAATLEIVAKLAPGVPFRERELSSILTKFEEQKIGLTWGVFMGLFKRSTAVESTSVSTRLLVHLLSDKIEVPSHVRQEDLSLLAEAALRAAVKQRNAHKALRLVEEAQRLDPKVNLKLSSLQEILQSTIERGDIDAVEKALDLLTSTASKDFLKLRLDEGQLLNLLNFAVSRHSMDLGLRAWKLYKEAFTVENSPEGTKRTPIPEAYHAKIHLHGKLQQFQEAFDTVHELETAHPTRTITWHRDLVSLVDTLANDPQNITDAQKVIEGRNLRGEPVSHAMTDSILAAAGQVNEIETAFELFDAFSAISPPTSDTYAAILKGCISCRMLESVPLIVREIAQKELPLTRQLMSQFVYFYIVARHCPGVLGMLKDMRAYGFEPSSELLEMALKRMEREGYEEGIAALSDEMGIRNWKMFSARNLRWRWKNVGGIEYLTSSEKFVARPDPMIQNGIVEREYQALEREHRPVERENQYQQARQR